MFAIGGRPAVYMYAQALCLAALTEFNPSALTIESFDIGRQFVTSGPERVNIGPRRQNPPCESQRNRARERQQANAPTDESQVRGVL